MQLMTWTLARLGSRFNLLFEPHRHRVRHSALGRFHDQPMDLMVGLIEPDGTELVLPFTTRGTPLHNSEQFERLNSITFRGYSERYRLRFEFNVHSVFYPQDEALCVMPVFYMEMRISPSRRIRGSTPAGPIPETVTLFIRLDRPDTHICAATPPAPTPGETASPAHNAKIDLAYPCALSNADTHETVEVHERIESLNPGCTADGDGKGLTLNLPVTDVGSGTKWRLVWGAHCDQPVQDIGPQPDPQNAHFRYLQYWRDLDAVMDDAIRLRDDRLAHSRRFEKLIDQTPLSMAQRHLLHQSFQTFLSNTSWCGLDDGTQQFSVSDGYQHDYDVGYATSMLYLAIWPGLLAIQLDRWADFLEPHPSSGGGYLRTQTTIDHDTANPKYPLRNPVDTSSEYLLLMQAYAHWTGDLTGVRSHAALIQQLAKYLAWTLQNTDGDSPKDTALAVKRLAALQGASDLLGRVDLDEPAHDFQPLIESEIGRLEQSAWLGDHYAARFSSNRNSAPTAADWAGQSTPFVETPGGDAYSIRTGDGLLLPAMTAQPVVLDPSRLRIDLANACRETLTAYGCGTTSDDIENVWISRNLWRDHLSRYVGCDHTTAHPQRYWDLQVMCNTHPQSRGYCDTYVGHNLSFNPRGATSFGSLLASPGLVIDRLAPGGTRISVDPKRHYPQRWPLLALADWKAGKIPVCVVDTQGKVTIEGESDPIIVHGDQTTSPKVIG